LTKALAAPPPLNGGQRLHVTVDRPPVVPLNLVGIAEEAVRQGLPDDVTSGRGQREGALGGNDCLIISAHEAEMDGQKP
jgi:hypothetical protein